MIAGMRGAICCLLLVLPSVVVRAATPQQIDSAIERAVKYLYSVQQPDGGWEAVDKPIDDPTGWKGAQFGGRTAIAIYALLSAGESPNDERIKRAVEFLSRIDTTGVYGVGMRCQVWSHLPDSPRMRQLLNREARILKSAMRTKDQSRGLYWYIPGTDAQYDHSVSQFAVLGMWACAEENIEVPANFWNESDRAWRAHQRPSGAWNYCLTGSPGQQMETPSMTAAGIATLFLTRDYARATEGVALKGNVVDSNIDKGLKWLAENFDACFDPSRLLDGYNWVGYTLYGVQRVGVASGLKYFGTIDWYKRGADHFVSQQQSNGSWTGACDTVPDTAMGILFLARGRAPVLISKLQYDDASGQPARWNQRPRDVANVVKWIGRQVERDFNWQIVNLDVSVDDLHDAPILYISGDQSLELSDEAQSRLKRFVQQGGLILGHADGKSIAFGKSFRALGQRLFPAYEFRELPADHVIYTGQQFPRSKWTSKPAVLGLGNGVRELMILLPDSDAGKVWQLQSFDRRELYQLAADIVQYATDKQNLRTRGDTHIVTPNLSTPPQRTVKLVRLEHAGNCDPEPAGWKRLGAILRNENSLDLSVSSAKPGEGKMAGSAIAHLTGTAKFAFDDKARAEIKSFVDAGGVLVIDSAGGSGEFASAVEAELTATFGDAAKQLADPMPASDPLFARLDIRYRAFAKQRLGAASAPQLRAIVRDGKALVYFSREDLSAGLVGQPVDGIVGLEPGTATELMRRIIMKSAK